MKSFVIRLLRLYLVYLKNQVFITTHPMRESEEWMQKMAASKEASLASCARSKETMGAGDDAANTCASFLAKG